MWRETLHYGPMGTLVLQQSDKQDKDFAHTLRESHKWSPAVRIWQLLVDDILCAFSEHAHLPQITRIQTCSHCPQVFKQTFHPQAKDRNHFYGSSLDFTLLKSIAISESSFGGLADFADHQDSCIQAATMRLCAVNLVNFFSVFFSRWARWDSNRSFT